MFSFWSSDSSNLDNWNKELSFTLNGKLITIPENDQDVTPDMSLNTYLRTKMNLTGTKFMCLEGGCGVCVVTLRRINPSTRFKETIAINSCLFPVMACDGCEIETIEGLKNGKSEPHYISQRLAHFGGSQCGYCSPAMVMSMYSLMEDKGHLTMAQIENSFGGNICRCTGYRPILDAFKSLAIDADEKLINYCAENDIEDIPKCPKSGQSCSQTCHIDAIKKCFSLNSDAEWRKATELSDMFHIFANIGNKKYMLVSGNTAHGVYRRSNNIKVFIDVNNVPELKVNKIKPNSIEIGGNTTLSKFMTILDEAAKNKPSSFEYCKEIYNHMDLVATIAVRNIGTVAGNLMIKHKHNEFPSDVYLTLETIGATITITDNVGSSWDMSIMNFLKEDMKRKVILRINLPALDNSVYKLKTYKMMQRTQNTHAYVNAGFLFKFNSTKKNTDYKNIQSCRICYGGIKPQFTHLDALESYLVGKNIFDNVELKKAIDILEAKIHPDWILPDSSPEFRKQLAIGLFYKCILNIAPEDVSIGSKMKTGGKLLVRPISSGFQTFDTYEKNYPLTKPVMKLEALKQCSGDAKYMNDLHHSPEDLWCAFVLATEINATIANIDTSRAMELDGVVAFYTTKDIPGKNTFTTLKNAFIAEEEDIFVQSRVKYHSQPAGIILAKTMDLALRASKLVKITYEKSTNEKIYSNTESVLRAELYDRIESEIQTKSEINYNDVAADMEITGKFSIGSQYHYTMEPQTTVCIPAEEGMEVYSSTQWIDATQVAIAEMLNLPSNIITLQVRRLGGAYGAKICRSIQIACACALACFYLKKTVRFVMSIEQMMNAIGKRNACMNNYKVKIDKTGVIKSLENEYFSDYGCAMNEDVTFFITDAFLNVYKTDGWVNKANKVRTDAPGSAWTRAPGDVEGIAMIENIIEHIAAVTKKDPTEIRLSNMDQTSVMPNMFRKFLKDSNFEERKKAINDYNNANRWKKKGISAVPMKYSLDYFGNFTAMVTIYHADGSVSISHGGIEVGQGINTKAAQVAASTLGIPLELVNVKPSTDFISPNSFPTGGSQTSQAIAFAVLKACEELVRRIEPVRSKMKGASWAEVTNACYAQLIDLSARYFWTQNDTKAYSIWGIAITEVKLDVLTGNVLLRRVDILEDTGESMSPLIDVGQVEGAFVMGIGYWLTENLVYNRQNGELLTNRTWYYKPPGAKDIPIDFRVTFLQKSSNPFGVLRSKATGEPPMCLAVVILFAIRDALNAARKDAGLPDDWYDIPVPCSPENILPLTGSQNSFYTL